ncbi:MAG TPA: sigma-70 family RNA polymerase sigma factor [Balneolales bacterium]|nr:sigma-70 family RNA polymerase sigma factor [Balneolales bacterium]
MAKSSVDYSDLVIAIQNDDQQKVDELIKEVIPRLISYLVVTMRADEYNAEECVYQSFIEVFQKVKEGKIKNENYIYSYLIKSARHEYLKYLKRNHRFYGDESEVIHLAEPAEQIENLLDDERQRILKECLKELKKKSRTFIEYFIDKPDATNEEASEEFNISNGNVRTKKSRILTIMHDCYQRKSNS